jgi:hypothetical protein
MIDEDRPKHAQKAKRKPQAAGLGSPTGWPGPSETCLMRRNRGIFGVQSPGSGEFRVEAGKLQGRVKCASRSLSAW